MRNEAAREKDDTNQMINKEVTRQAVSKCGKTSTEQAEVIQTQFQNFAFSFALCLFQLSLSLLHIIDTNHILKVECAARIFFSFFATIPLQPILCVVVFSLFVIFPFSPSLMSLPVPTLLLFTLLLLPFFSLLTFSTSPPSDDDIPDGGFRPSSRVVEVEIGSTTDSTMLQQEEMQYGTGKEEHGRKFHTSHHAEEHQAQHEHHHHHHHPPPTDTPTTKESTFTCQCGHHLAAANNLIYIRSPLAEKRRVIRYGTSEQSQGHEYEIQHFINPQAQPFDLLLFSSLLTTPLSAPHSFLEHTWFPHYSWRIIACDKCHQHLGWQFERELNLEGDGKRRAGLEQFFGIIVDRVKYKTGKS